MEKVVAIDPLGSRYLGPTGIVDAFIIQEGGYANRYTPDPQTVEAKKLTAPPSPVDDEAIWQQRFGFPYAMSLEALETDLNKGMKGLGESSSATIVSPEFSGVNIPNDVANIMRRISKVTRAELIQIIVKRQSHTGIMDQHAPLFAQLITDMLKG